MFGNLIKSFYLYTVNQIEMNEAYAKLLIATWIRDMKRKERKKKK